MSYATNKSLNSAHAASDAPVGGSDNVETPTVCPSPSNNDDDVVGGSGLAATTDDDALESSIQVLPIARSSLQETMDERGATAPGPSACGFGTDAGTDAGRTSPELAARAGDAPPSAQSPSTEGEVLALPPSRPKTLEDRMPAPARVLQQLRKSGEIEFLLEHSRFKGEGERDIFFVEEIWKGVNDRMCKALRVCAATGEADTNKMSAKYQEATMDMIDSYASKLHESLPSSQQLQDVDKRVDASLIMQVMCMEYIDSVHALISYPSSQGEAFTTEEEVGKKVEHACSVGVNDLFSVPDEKSNVYYIIGFLGNQAQKEAKRRAKDSGVKMCLEFISGEKFKARNKGQEAEVDELIHNNDIPTDLVQRRESFGGLRYATNECWEFFALIEYIYAEMAVPNNFIRRGGRLLTEISEGILHNSPLRKKFASFCGYDFSSEQESKFSLDDTAMAFRFFLKVFGRVRAKDITLKYNSQLYKGKNTVALRAGLAATTGGKKKNAQGKVASSGSGSGSSGVASSGNATSGNATSGNGARSSAGGETSGSGASAGATSGISVSTTGGTDDLSKLTVKLLKERCKELHLHVSGRKHELIDRITTYYTNKKQKKASQAGQPAARSAPAESTAERNDHAEILKTLVVMDSELEDEVNSSNKLCSPVVEENIEMDASS